MVVFMLVGSLEPKPPEPAQQSMDAGDAGLESPPAGPASETESEGLLPKFPYSQYPWIYTARIGLTVLAMALVWPGYRTFPWKVHRLSVLVGLAGIVLWVGLCHLQLEQKLIGPVDRGLGRLIPGLEPGDTPTIGLMDWLGTGQRSAFNPLKEMADQPAAAWLFLAVRFFGLAVVVPVIEEFFLRGFLMRFVMHQMWWRVPFGVADRTALVVGTAVPMLMHPGELFAALVWFSMVTWLMVRTKNIWDCVAAHAVTNFLLGVYVVTFDQWQLM